MDATAPTDALQAFFPWGAGLLILGIGIFFISRVIVALRAFPAHRRRATPSRPVPEAVVGRLRALMAEGQKLRAVDLHMEATDASLGEALAYLSRLRADDIARGAPRFPDEARAEVLRLLDLRKTLRANTVYRDVTGAKHAQARRAVKKLRSEAASIKALAAPTGGT